MSAARVRAWKLFVLLPRLLLARSAQFVSEGRAALIHRVELFLHGRFDEFPTESLASCEQASTRRRGEDSAKALCCSLCHCQTQRTLANAPNLDSGGPSPGNADTFRALTWYIPIPYRSAFQEKIGKTLKLRKGKKANKKLEKRNISTMMLYRGLRWRGSRCRMQV